MNGTTDSIYGVAGNAIQQHGLRNVLIGQGGLMGFAMRTSGGIATAVLMLTGMAVAQPAYARQTVSVPCSAAALVAAVIAANTAGSGTLLLASNCNYVLPAPSAVGRGPDGLL